MARPTFPVLTDDDQTGLTGTIINNEKVNEIKEYITKGLELKNLTELTIATGVITITEASHTVDTEANAETDDLDTINGGTTGALVVLKAADDARTIVVKHNTGNIWLKGKSDLSLDDLEDGLLLFYTGTKWIDLGGGVGGAGGADFYSRALYIGHYEDLDTFGTVIDTGGSITQGDTYLTLTTAATTGYRSYAIMKRYPWWIPAKKAEAQALIKPETLTDCYFSVAFGNPSLPIPDSGQYVGFFFQTGSLIAASRGETDKTTVTISGVDASLWHFYKIIYEPDVKVEFYVDGILKATIDTNLPDSGVGWQCGGLQTAIKTAANTAKSLYASLLVAEGDI